MTPNKIHVHVHVRDATFARSRTTKNSYRFTHSQRAEPGDVSSNSATDQKLTLSLIHSDPIFMTFCKSMTLHLAAVAAASDNCRQLCSARLSTAMFPAHPTFFQNKTVLFMLAIHVHVHVRSTNVFYRMVGIRYMYSLSKVAETTSKIVELK